MHPRRERRPRHLGPPQGGQDRHPALRQRGTQVPGGGESVPAGRLDVEHRHRGPVRERGGDDRVAVGHLRHDLHVRLQTRQGDQCPADLRVLGRQDPDHAPASGPRGARSTSRVISLGAKTRNGGPQKPVPRLV
ncbi:hypothetical protein GCM10010363_29340 [Streptomyces omiyaensis]|nr:hypothetical protein GCM10010363_29340 [Streptomyces omiyaensis]